MVEFVIEDDVVLFVLVIVLFVDEETAAPLALTAVELGDDMVLEVLVIIELVEFVVIGARQVVVVVVVAPLHVL